MAMAPHIQIFIRWSVTALHDTSAISCDVRRRRSAVLAFVLSARAMEVPAIVLPACCTVAPVPDWAGSIWHYYSPSSFILAALLLTGINMHVSHIWTRHSFS